MIPSMMRPPAASTPDAPRLIPFDPAPESGACGTIAVEADGPSTVVLTFYATLPGAAGQVAYAVPGGGYLTVRFEPHPARAAILAALATPAAG